jgi:transcriptional regulator with XRE-family HTH domain
MAERVKGRREAMGWTLDDLADELGCGRQTIYRVEHGQPVPSSEIAEWAEALGVSATWIVGWTDEEQPDAEVTALLKRARRLDAAKRKLFRERLSRLPRRPQARCAARPGEGDITRPRSRAA